MYITQKGFYLYSNALSISTWVPILVKDISSIEHKIDDKMIILQTTIQTFKIRTILRSLNAVEKVLKLIWQRHKNKNVIAISSLNSQFYADY